MEVHPLTFHQFHSIIYIFVLSYNWATYPCISLAILLLLAVMAFFYKLLAKGPRISGAKSIGRLGCTVDVAPLVPGASASRLLFRFVIIVE